MKKMIWLAVILFPSTLFAGESVVKLSSTTFQLNKVSVSTSVVSVSDLKFQYADVLDRINRQKKANLDAMTFLLTQKAILELRINKAIAAGVPVDIQIQ